MKKFLFLGVVFFLIFVMHSLIGTIIDLWQKQHFFVRAKQELAFRKEENSKLKKQLVLVNSPSFIEEQARDKLLFLKKEESVVVLPPKTIPDPKVLGQALLSQEANWRQWLKLFF